MNDAMGQFWGLEAAPQPDGGLAIVTSPTAALPTSQAQTSGTVTTAGVFQTALTGGPYRHGCIIQNVSPANEYVTVSTIPSIAASRLILPDGVYQCVSTLAIEITSLTAGSTFEVENW